MNRNIQAMQYSHDARKIYDALVNLLIKGYEQISEAAPANAKVSGCGIVIGKIRYENICHARKPKEKGLLSDFAKWAMEIIKSEFSNPFALIVTSPFSHGCTATSDPIAEHILARLNSAKALLDENIHYSKVQPATKAHRVAITDDTPQDPSPWLEAFQTLEAKLKSPDIIKAAPWIWLGINMTWCYNLLPDYDIFESLSLPVDKLKAVGVIISLDDYTTPEYVNNINQSLSAAKNIILEWKVGGQKTIKKLTTKFHPWTNSGDARFIIDNNKVKFYYKGKMKDLRLRNEAKLHKLLFLFAANNPLPQVEIERLRTEHTRPSDIVKRANTDLNKKLEMVGFTDKPQNVQFVKHDRKNGVYGLSPEIKHKDALDSE
jgi:hypothetical protein